MSAVEEVEELLNTFLHLNRICYCGATLQPIEHESTHSWDCHSCCNRISKNITTRYQSQDCNPECEYKTIRGNNVYSICPDCYNGKKDLIVSHPTLDQNKSVIFKKFNYALDIITDAIQKVPIERYIYRVFKNVYKWWLKPCMFILIHHSLS